MARIRFDLPTSTAATASLLFHESRVSITRKSVNPIQQIEMAISGKEYVRSLSPNTEELWEIDFTLLHESDEVESTSLTDAGYASLKAFIASTSTGAGYCANTFEVTDADGDSLVGRYLSGIESFVEGGQRQRGKATQFSGSILFRKTISS